MPEYLSVIVVFLVCCVVKYDAAITDAQLSKIHTKVLTSGLNCMKDHPLKFEHITAFRARQVPDDEDATCFVKCFYTQLGIMDDTGKVSESKARASARKIFKEGDELLPMVDDVITECAKVNEEETSDGDKGCDRAKLAFQCFVKNASKLGLDVDL